MSPQHNGKTSPKASESAAVPIPPRPRGLVGWVCRYMPAFDVLRNYSAHDLSADVVAGLTVATVAVPQAMAYAMLAGLKPEYGLYTAVVMTAVGALFASSRQLINGPTNAISIALLSALAVLPESERNSAALVFTLLVGLIQLGIALLRRGDLTRYISHAVIVGFTLGAGTLLVMDQLKNLLGLRAQGDASDHFLKRFWLTMTSGERWHLPTMAVGFGTMALVVGMRKVNVWMRRKGVRLPIPQHLVAVVIMAAVVWAFHLEEHNVKIVGTIPSSLPAPSLPRLPWDQVGLLTGNAFGVAILGLLEAIAMAKSLEARTGLRLDINQQCLSEGMANIAGSFFHCMPGSGSLTRSAVNQQAGAVTQWSGVFSAIAVALTILSLARFAGYIPQASLAGLLLLASYRMVDHRQLLFHLRATRFDALIVIATALAAVLISVEFCVLIGVFLSFLLYVPRAAQVQMTELTLTADRQVRDSLPNDPRCGRMLLYSLEGELSFGAAPELEAHLAHIEHQARRDVRVVLLQMKRARNPDGVFLTLLGDFFRRLQKQKVELILWGVRPDLARALHNTRLSDDIGPNHIVPELTNSNAPTQDAVAFAYALVGTDVCPDCPRQKGGPAATS